MQQRSVISEVDEDFINTEVIESFVDFLYRRLKVEKEKELNVLLCTDERIQQLNKEFRKRDSATNVLAFYGYSDEILGDIAISVDTLKREAQQKGEDPFDYLLFLLAHGFLHLLGYTHDTMNDYTEMVELQKKLIEEWKNEKTS